MPELVELILKKLAPYIRAELDGFGYPSHIPDSDDLLQEIYIRLWKALEARGGQIEFINSYAKKVVFSVYINEVNRIRRERQLISVAENQQRLEGDGTVCGPGSDDFVKEIVIKSLSALSRTKRRVIKLRLEGFTLAEIARLNHWSLSKVCNNYYRGIRELKQKLAKRGIYHED